MDWSSLNSIGGTWTAPITNLEAKQAIAKKLADRLQPNDVVGIGSGSTAFLAAQAIALRATEENIPFTAITTSHEVGLACASLGVTTTSIMHRKPAWSFDGCDEVDPKRNMIKGRGGAMFREKLLMKSSPEIYILADASKFVEALCEKFPIPIEVYPESVSYVMDVLRTDFKPAKTMVRAATGKDGPIITESGNLIIDAHFPGADAELEAQLKSITGVIETGLFTGYNFELVSG